VRGSGLTWGDAIAVEGLLFGEFLALSKSLFPCNLGIQRSPETTRSLLVHFCAGSNTVHGHEEQLFRFDLPEQMFNVVEYPDEHLIFAQAELRVIRVFVGAVVDDTVHVEVEGVELGDTILGDELRDRRIAL